MNRQSNLYTIIYSTVLVLVVGVVLSVVYQALRPQQLENIANDTKRQILASARIAPENGESVAQLFDSHISERYIVNSKGEKIDGNTDPFKVNVAMEVKKPAEERMLPVFECTTDNGLKYIVPVYGAGLWGPQSGAMWLSMTMATPSTAHISLTREKPRVSYEIEKPTFSGQFDGKNIFSDNGEFTSVAVVKTGKEPAGRAWVHAVSGGTITSQGVQKMLFDSLGTYSAFFRELKNNTSDK